MQIINNTTDNPKHYGKKVNMVNRYGVCAKTIHKWTQMELLIYIKIGRVIRYDMEACDASLRRHGYLS
jgi:hypothetical protein